MRKLMGLVVIGSMLTFASQARAQLGVAGGVGRAVGNTAGQATGNASGGGVAGQATGKALGGAVSGQGNGQISGNGAGQTLDVNQGGAINGGNGTLNVGGRVGTGVVNGAQVPALNGNGGVNVGNGALNANGRVGVGSNDVIPGGVDAHGGLNTGVGGNLNVAPGQSNSGLNARGQMNGQSTFQGGAAMGQGGQLPGQRITAYSQGGAAGNLATGSGWSNGGNHRRGFRIFPIFRNRAYSYR